MIEAITFDVNRTLLYCPRLGEIYSEVLGRHGVAVAPREALRLIGLVWQELACLAEPGRDRFSSHSEGARGWWRRFLDRFCEHLGAGAPSPFAAAELYQRFAHRESWEVYPEVPAVLDLLRARGLRLGVISNWDERLPGLLAELDLAPRFDSVLTSSAAGTEKPDPRIFRQALRALRVRASAALHVGDSRLEDVEGAMAAGMRALLIARREPAGGRPRKTPPERPARDHLEATALRDLSPLPGLVAAGCSEASEASEA